jgi:acetyltransferase-like isoleucine patch superfamily enzyme
VNHATTFGTDTHINGLRVYGKGEVTIGSHVHIGKGCEILTQNHNFKSQTCLPYDDEYIKRPVTIGDFSWLGINVLLLPGSHIGEGAIVQAGSVVSGKIAPLSIVGGNPARPFARRNTDDFMEVRSRYDIPNPVS